MVKIKMKKILIFVLALSFIFHFSLPAETNANASLEFSDVSINWSYKYISKLAALGVISGRGDGTFAPNDPVTHQEVLIMAIQLMGESEEAIEQGRTHILPPALEVSEWAKGHVGLALQRNLINIDEELAALENSDTNVAWGSQNASREWVAKITIRAIGKQLQAEILADQIVTFADRAQITPGFEGYINAAVQLGIVSGMPGNVFNPTDPVTRAQMAVFLSRAEEYLDEKPEHVLIGHLLQVDENSAELQDASGGTYALEFSDSTKFFSYQINDAPIDRSELQPYQTVYVIHEHGKVLYIEIIDDEPTVQIDTLQGALMAVDESFEEMTLWIDGKYEIFNYTSSTKVIGENGAALDIEDLITGSIVKVKVIEDEERTIQEIEIIEVPVNKVSEGTLKQIDPAEGTIVIADKNSKEEERYSLLGEVEVTYGNRSLELDELQEGDVIEYRVDDSVVTEITVLEPVEPLFDVITGVIESMNLTNRTLSIRTADGSLPGYDISQNAKVVMEGRPSADLEDLEIADQVRLSINVSSGRVEKIEIMNRSILTVARAELVRFLPETKDFIVILPGEDRSRVFHMNADTVVDQVINNEVEAIEKIYTPGKVIDLTFTNDRLMRVAISNHYDGVISYIDHMNRIIHLDHPEFGTLKFPWTTGTIFETGSSNARITDFVIGDKARITFEGTQHYASRIQLIHESAYRLVSVSISPNELVVHDGKEEKKLRVLSNVPITGADGRRIALADLPLNRTIHVSFVGTSIIAVHVPQIELGKIANIDLARERLTIETFDRSIVTYDLSNLRQVILDASPRNGSLHDLRVGDRVEVAVDQDERTIITRLSLEYKTFWRYNNRTSTIEFRKKMMSEESTFTLSPDVHVHDGTTQVSPTTFKDGDELAVYFLNRQIMEIEKR